MYHDHMELFQEYKVGLTARSKLLQYILSTEWKKNQRIILKDDKI